MSRDINEATDQRPVWEVDADKGEIRRHTGVHAPVQLVAKWDTKTGVVELQEGFSTYRAAVTAVLRADPKGFFSVFGKIGENPEKPKAPLSQKPKKGFRQGEKTPARVEWMAENMPQTFLGMWGVIQMQVRSGYENVERIAIDERTKDRYITNDKVPVYEDVEGFDFSVAKIKAGEQRLIAHAKTCLTIKSEESADLSEYDESLDRPTDEDEI